jgi:hypothetical protein
MDSSPLDALDELLAHKDVTLEMLAKALADLDVARDKVANKIIDVNEEIKQKEDEQKREAEYCKNHKNIYDLMHCIANYDQVVRIQKLNTQYPENMLYLVDYKQNTDTKKKDVLGSFTILGTYNYSKQSREQYEVRLYKHNTNTKGTFWCSCLDQKLNSGSKNTVCKHICFIVCRVAKIMTQKFFDTKHLGEVEIASLINKVTSGQFDKNLQRTIAVLCIESFKEKKKQIEEGDVCPICYDEFGTKQLLSCPTCTNYVHDECMMVWMEKQHKCVYCTSKIWENYDRCKGGATIHIGNTL